MTTFETPSPEDSQPAFPSPSASVSSDSGVPIGNLGWLQTLKGIGPAMVVAAVVLGPGSITTASRVGCRYGYELGWVLVITTVLMIGMTWAALVAGVSYPETAGTRLRNRFGKVPTTFLGICVFLIVALFQSSNNRALLLAAELVYPEIGTDTTIATIALLVFNGAVILFFLFARSVYRIVERSMLLMVGTMLVCFGINAVLGSLDFWQGLTGLVPSAASINNISGQLTGDLRAMIGTTFSVAGAFYQAYLVRERGWTRGELRRRWIDPVLGIGTLGFLTMLIMWTSAAALNGKVDPAAIIDLRSLASSLQPTFGPLAAVVFAAGILAGAVSSFVGNALVGGTVLSDCCGGSANASDNGPRSLTILALLIGMAVALLSVVWQLDSVAFILVAQGLTTLGLPLMALTILWLLLNSEKKRGFLLVIVVAGCCLSFFVAGATLVSLL